jgi:hypothetical protein
MKDECRSCGTPHHAQICQVSKNVLGVVLYHRLFGLGQMVGIAIPALNPRPPFDYAQGRHLPLCGQTRTQNIWAWAPAAPGSS